MRMRLPVLLCLVVGSCAGVVPAKAEQAVPPPSGSILPGEPTSPPPPPVYRPDRDWEFRLQYPEVGMAIAFYPVQGFSLQGSFGYQFFKDYSFLEPYLTSEGEDLVYWTVGFTTVLSLGVAYDLPVKYALFKPKDSLELRASLRFRQLFIAKIDGVDYSPTVGSAGFARSFPLMGGLTYTYWVLPDAGGVGSRLSRLSDLGLFCRLEAGADFITYHMYQVDTETAALVEIPAVEFISNFSAGLVF